MSKIIHLLSGGLDSTILLRDLVKKGHEVECITFAYGQMHSKEIGYASRIAKELNVPHQLIDLGVFNGCALVGDKQLRNGASETAIVPNRNMVFLSIAASIAVQKNIRTITWAAVQDDVEVFPDCRYESFLKPLNEALSIWGVKVSAPYIENKLYKKDLIDFAIKEDIKFTDTWSCYRGGDVPCGKCGACLARAKAMSPSHMFPPSLKETI